MCFSQYNSSLYQDAINNYNEENYTIALTDFKKVKDHFHKEKDVLNVINCLVYISQIYSLQSDYKASVSNSDKALSYFKTQNFTNDSLYSELLSNKTLALKFLGKFKDAFQTSDSLINYLKVKKENKKYLANAHQIKSRVEIDLGKYDDAIASARKSILLNANTNEERRAALLNIIGVGFYFKEELDSASYYYNESYKIKREIKVDNYQLAIATFNIGIVKESIGAFDEAIVFYNKAVAYDLLDRGEEVGVLSDLYVALANTYFKKNDLEKAEEFANKALRIALKKYGEDSPNTSFVYVSYANIFELKGDYRKNIEYTKKALNIRRKTYGNNHRWTAESLLSIGEAHIELKEFNEAEKMYSEALTIGKTIDNNLMQAYAEMGLGIIYVKTNKHDLASRVLQASKSKFIEAFGNYHETHLSLLVTEAENYFKKGESKKALEVIETIKENATENKLFYHLDALTLQLDIAFNDFEKYQNSKLLKDIVTHIDDAIDLIIKIRKDYPTSKSKIYVNNGMNAFISKAIKAAYVLYEKTEKPKYLEPAFKLSEINKSSTLVSGIQDIRFKKMANIPEALLKFENNLNYQLADIKKEMYYEENEEKPDNDYMNQLLSEQLKYRASLDSLLQNIEQQYPKYYQLKYNTKTTSISELQKSIIDKDETLIEYFFGENDLYVFVISKTRADFLQLSSANQIRKLVEDFRVRLKQQKGITEQSKALYRLLLKDLNLETKRLIIIPDKELNHLPFEVLINENDNFVIEDYIMSYSGSSSLLEAQEDDFSDFKFTSSWSGFAPIYSENKTLIANQTEIKTIAQLMKGEAFLGAEASLINFKKQTQNASILHLATHAQVDHNNPLYNQLVFSKDSVLTASDIYTLQINADLTVLSACETGFGKLEKGEGVMSMSRAFQYAGVKSTVMSLWKIPDQESSKLMVSFYEYLKKGLPKDEALQKAKLDYLKSMDDEALKHPFYWSGFIISGDVSALESNSITWLIALILAVIVVLFLFRKQLLKFVK